MGRGSNNLNYDDGFWEKNYKIFEPVLKNILESKPTRRNQ
jgi:hypothetical protein